MSSFIEGLVIGSFLGYIGCVIAIQYREHHKRWILSNERATTSVNHERETTGQTRTLRHRDLREQARAAAFGTLYEFCNDQTYAHYVSEEDKTKVVSRVRSFLSDRRDLLSETYIGREHFEIAETEMAEEAVEAAVELFLRI